MTYSCRLCSQRSYSIQCSDEPHYNMEPLTITMRPYIFLQLSFSFATFNHAKNNHENLHLTCQGTMMLRMAQVPPTRVCYAISAL